MQLHVPSILILLLVLILVIFFIYVSNFRFVSIMVIKFTSLLVCWIRTLIFLGRADTSQTANLPLKHIDDIANTKQKKVIKFQSNIMRLDLDDDSALLRCLCHLTAWNLIEMQPVGEKIKCVNKIRFNTVCNKNGLQHCKTLSITFVLVPSFTTLSLLEE